MLRKSSKLENSTHFHLPLEFLMFLTTIFTLVGSHLLFEQFKLLFNYADSYYIDIITCTSIKQSILLIITAVQITREKIPRTTSTNITLNFNRWLFATLYLCQGKANNSSTSSSTTSVFLWEDQTCPLISTTADIVSTNLKTWQRNITQNRTTTLRMLRVL